MRAASKKMAGRTRIGPRRAKPGRLKYEVPAIQVQLAFRLTEPASRPLTIEEIVREFAFQNPRRAQRYLAGLRVGVFNGTFHGAVLRLEDRDGNEVIPTDADDIDLRDIRETRIARARLVTRGGEDVVSPEVRELMPVYMAFTALRYLEGIIPRDEVSLLWRDLVERAGPRHAVRMAELDRKFYLVPYAPKPYSEASVQGILVEAIDALVNQHVVKIEYFGFGEGHTHRFEPYTLAMYKGGLYLLGRSDRYERPICLAVERIDRIEKVSDEDTGEPLTFAVPAEYSPAKHFQGVFGIMQGPETTVVLEIQKKETEARLKERIIHPSQEFLPPLEGAGRDGDGYRKARMRMTVRGTEELAMWILHQGPYVKVLEPESLRRRVEELLEQSLGLYRSA
ncbi:MAG: WYL domain-containing protein [Candidatus Binatia bacterium]